MPELGVLSDRLSLGLASDGAPNGRRQQHVARFGMFWRQDILKLLTDRLGPCVSIYMPTRANGPATREDLVRYQNLLRGVENDLILRGFAVVNAGELLADAKALIEDETFWRTESEGLALFIAPDFFVARRVPCAVRTAYRIDKRFHVAPLLPLVDATRRFFILALNQDSARFFEATPRSISEVMLGEPDAELEPMATTGRRVATVRQPSAFDVAGSPTSSGGPAWSDGGTFSADPVEADLIQFLRTIDRELRGCLRGERVPLVLACVGFLASLYEGVNSYERLLPVKVPGSPVNWTTRELHSQALRIVHPYLERDRLEARRRYESAEMGECATTDAASIANAAEEGQVDTLFLPDPCGGGGDFESDGESAFFGVAGDDLREIVAGKTLLSGGSLCILEKDEMPGGRFLAAILRPPEQLQGNAYRTE